MSNTFFHNLKNKKDIYLKYFVATIVIYAIFWTTNSIGGSFLEVTSQKLFFVFVCFLPTISLPIIYIFIWNYLTRNSIKPNFARKIFYFAGVFSFAIAIAFLIHAERIANIIVFDSFRHYSYQLSILPIMAFHFYFIDFSRGFPKKSCS